MKLPGRARRPPYKLLSLLLQYPSVELLEQRDALGEAIADLPRSREREELQRFFSWFGSAGGVELQQEYVATFDLEKRSSLYLTFFTHGDTRQRGLALLRLKRLYAAAGLRLQGPELPDYLPLMLEFAALAPEDAGRGLLGEHRSSLELLRLHLREAGSRYQHLAEAVCAGLPRLHSGEIELVRRLTRDGPPSEQVGLQPYPPADIGSGLGSGVAPSAAGSTEARR